MPLDASVVYLLSCIVEKFVAPEGECQCAFGGEGSLVCSLKDRTVYCRGESRNGLASPRLPLAMVLPLVDAMVLLQGYAHRPSKCAFAGDAQAVLRWLAEVIHADIEASRDDEGWAKASHTLLPRMGGETRARRIPLGSKLDLAKEVSETTNLRSVQQFIAEVAGALVPGSRGGGRAEHEALPNIIVRHRRAEVRLELAPGPHDRVHVDRPVGALRHDRPRDLRRRQSRRQQGAAVGRGLVFGQEHRGVVASPGPPLRWEVRGRCAARARRPYAANFDEGKRILQVLKYW